MTGLLCSWSVRNLLPDILRNTDISRDSLKCLFKVHLFSTCWSIHNIRGSTMMHCIRKSTFYLLTYSNFNTCAQRMWIPNFSSYSAQSALWETNSCHHATHLHYRRTLISRFATETQNVNYLKQELTSDNSMILSSLTLWSAHTVSWRNSPAIWLFHSFKTSTVIIHDRIATRRQTGMD